MKAERDTACVFVESGDMAWIAAEAGYVPLDPEEGVALVAKTEIACGLVVGCCVIGKVLVEMRI